MEYGVLPGVSKGVFLDGKWEFRGGSGGSLKEVRGVK